MILQTYQIDISTLSRKMTPFRQSENVCDSGLGFELALAEIRFRSNVLSS